MQQERAMVEERRREVVRRGDEGMVAVVVAVGSGSGR